MTMMTAISIRFILLLLSVVAATSKLFDNDYGRSNYTASDAEIAALQKRGFDSNEIHQMMFTYAKPALPRRSLQDTVVTYRPGELTVRENGVILSTGLKSRIVAVTGERVRYTAYEGISTERFHVRPDGAAVFPHPATGGWAYVSNSEVPLKLGGVGAIYFNAQGEVIGYRRLLRLSSWNCGGGPTWWGTWMSGEEYDRGQVWEVYPFNDRPPRKTLIGAIGRTVGRLGPFWRGLAYESVAFDNRNPANPAFYATNDRPNSVLVRFTPDPDAVAEARRTGDYSELLHARGDFGHSFLLIDREGGTFDWTTDYEAAAASGEINYPGMEGIDIVNGMMYVTSKTDKLLWIFDLDAKTFTVSSTVSGAFNDQPDQVKRLLGDNVVDEDILYFCEDGSGGECGIHGRDGDGKYFTILQGDEEGLQLETTGLAFSPDHMFMYLAFQSPGVILAVHRTDGLPFGGQTLDIKYHTQT